MIYLYWHLGTSLIKRRSTALMCVCNVFLYSCSSSSVFLSIHLSVCLCVCLVPPHVISPSGQPPHQTSLQAVSRCHPSIWLCGMSQPFSREGCLTTIRLHPSQPLCLLPSVLVSSFPNLHVCVFVSGMNGGSVSNEVFCHTFGSYSSYNFQLDCKASTWM